MLPVKIVSTGCYIPSIKVLSTDLDHKFGFSTGTVEKRTGICSRYYGNEVETSPYMGAKAIEAALTRAQLTLDDIDAVVSISGTAAQLLPSTATLIAAELESDKSKGWRRLVTFDINAACMGFLIGLDTMSHLIVAGRYRRVVLVASENISSCLSPTEFESAAIAGDAAVAVILERAADTEPSQLSATSFELALEGIEWSTVRGLGTARAPSGLRPATPEENVFSMQGHELFYLAIRHGTDFFNRFLEENKLQRSDIDLFIAHQSNGQAVASASRLCGWPEERHFVYVREYGNTVAASIPLGVHFAIEQGRLKRGHRVLMAGQGAGLAMGFATIVY